jgi:ABC-2 type transport system ATP-binding protein
MLERVGLSDRANDRIERLSGGMQRRVEIAKGVLHRPRLMIMDEPSTGLDPGARRDLWQYLRQLRDRDGLTILITTHLMDEADWCDRVAILDRGALVALGAPSELSRQLGGEIISLQAHDPARLAQRITTDMGLACTVEDNCVRIEQERGRELVPRLFDSYSGEIQAITVRRPSLDDFFVRIRAGACIE